MRDLPRLPLRFWLAFGLVAAVLWIAIGFALRQEHRRTIEAAAATGRNLARSLAEFELSSIRAVDLSLRMLRDEWARDPSRFDAAVRRHAEHLREERVIQVAVVDRDGWVVYSRLPNAPSVNYADREYFHAQKAAGRADRLHVSQPVFGRVTRQWAIQFTRPLHDRDGEFAGLIVVAVPPPALEHVYREIHLGERAIIALVRFDGEVLARTGDVSKGRRIEVAGAPGLADDGPVSGEFMGDGRVDGTPRYLAYHRLRGLPLTVYVGQDLQEVLAPYRASRRLLLSGGAVGTLLILVAMYLLVSRRRADRERARLENEVLAGERRFLDERSRMMLELHDGCIQAIYAIGLHLQACRGVLERQPAAAARMIREAQADLSVVIQDLRAFIAGGTPAVLSEEEFMAEMDRIIPSASTRPAFSLDIDRAAVRALSGEQAMHLLRISREAVSNIVRHAEATRARVSLRAVGGAVRLEVQDDGNGLARASDRPGLGLHHIEARARKLGGRAEVESAPGSGTRIAVEFALPA